MSSRSLQRLSWPISEFNDKENLDQGVNGQSYCGDHLMDRNEDPLIQPLFNIVFTN